MLLTFRHYRKQEHFLKRPDVLTILVLLAMVVPGSRPIS